MIESKFLKINVWFMNLIGLWPMVRKPSWNTWIYKAHDLYSKMVFVSFLIFLASEFIEIYFLFADLHDLFSNLSVSLLDAVALVKAQICTTTKMKSLVKRICNVENGILESNDVDYKNLYSKTVRYNYKMNIYILYLGFSGMTLFALMPLLQEKVNPPECIRCFNAENNGTYYGQRALIFKTWFPFNPFEYFKIVFTYHVIYGFLGTGFVIVPDIVLCAVMIFATGQLQLLQYSISNYRKTAKCMFEKRPAGPFNLDDVEYEVVIRCIKQHQRIIKFIKDLDILITYLMLLDFFISSMQMAVVAFQIIVDGLNVMILLGVYYLFCLLSQLFLFYWHGNELMLESLGVANAIWDCDWYESSPRVKQLLIIMLARSQKPLILTVGPFYYMTTETAISVLRGAYSYITLFRQMYLRH